MKRKTIILFSVCMFLAVTMKAADREVEKLLSSDNPYEFVYWESIPADVDVWLRLHWEAFPSNGGWEQRIDSIANHTICINLHRTEGGSSLGIMNLGRFDEGEYSIVVSVADDGEEYTPYVIPMTISEKKGIPCGIIPTSKGKETSWQYDRNSGETTVEYLMPHFDVSVTNDSLHITGFMCSYGKSSHFVYYEIHGDSISLVQLAAESPFLSSWGQYSVDMTIGPFYGDECVIATPYFEIPWSNRFALTNAISTHQSSRSNSLYDLQGRPVAEPQHGIYIQNGKKVLKR